MGSDTPAEVAPSSSGDRRRGPALLWVSLLVVFGLVAGGWTLWNSLQPALVGKTAPPLPVGDYEGLTAWETPTVDIGEDSRFVFEQEREQDTAYWHAYPSGETRYAVNGSDVTVEEFEAALGLPPMWIDVTAVEDGVMGRIDIWTPGAPSEP